MTNAAATPSIPHAEFRERRERLLAELGGWTGLVLAGEADSSLHHPWKPHAHFEYLTGITDEPGAMLLLDPSNPVPSKRATLLLKPLNPEVEKWDGFRHELGSGLRAKTGFDTVLRTGMLGRLLLEATRRSRSLACLMPLSAYSSPVSADLAIMRAQAERLATTSFTSATSVSTSVSATVSSVTRVTAVTTVTTVTSVSATVTSVTNVTSVTATVGGDVVVAVEHHPAQRRAQNRLGLAEPGYARPARGPRAARALAAARGRVAVEQRGHADERNCQSHRADSR